MLLGLSSFRSPWVHLADEVEDGQPQPGVLVAAVGVGRQLCHDRRGVLVLGHQIKQRCGQAGGGRRSRMARSGARHPRAAARAARGAPAEIGSTIW